MLTDEREYITEMYDSETDNKIHKNMNLTNEQIKQDKIDSGNMTFYGEDVSHFTYDELLHAFIYISKMYFKFDPLTFKSDDKGFATGGKLKGQFVVETEQTKGYREIIIKL